MNRVTIPAYDS